MTQGQHMHLMGNRRHWTVISRRVKKPDPCDWKQTLCLEVVNCYLPECNKGYCCLATAITHGCNTTPATGNATRGYLSRVSLPLDEATSDRKQSELLRSRWNWWSWLLGVRSRLISLTSEAVSTQVWKQIQLQTEKSPQWNLTHPLVRFGAHGQQGNAKGSTLKLKNPAMQHNGTTHVTFTTCCVWRTTQQ